MQLSIAKKLAYDLLREEGLLALGWTFDFDDAKRRLGACHYRHKKITLSRYYIALNPDEVILNTIRHEVAHALTPGAKHGRVWKREAVRLGARPESCTKNAVSPDADFIGSCVKCGKESKRHREPKHIGNMACSICCNQYSGGKFDERFLLVWRNKKSGEVFREGFWEEDLSASGKANIDVSIASQFTENFGAASVINTNQIGTIHSFQFDNYDFRNVPVGVVKAFLDLKLWKDVKGYQVLNTYWQTEKGQGVIYGVWLNTYTDKYETADKSQDISTLPVGNWYELIVMANPKGYLRLQSIKYS